MHRLHLQFRHQVSETLNDFISRSRALANDLSQKLGYKCNQLLIDGRKYEALIAGKQKINDLNSAEAKPVDAINNTQTCSRCGTMHKPRSSTIHLI